MAVTKSQLAQWSKEYEKKYPEKKNTEAAQTAANGTNTARPKAERVTKAQLAQWSAEFDAGQAAKQEQEKNALRSKAFDEYRANNNLGFADEMDSRRDWLNQQDMGTKDIYKDVNRWKDTDDNRNLSEAVKRIDGTHGAYTDADLIKNSNWTQADIDRARAINQQYETLPLAYRAGRRLGNSAKSLAASVAGAGAMAAGALPQAVGTEIKDDDRTRTLMRAIQRVDGTNGMYTDKDLVSAGWTEEEIKDARARLAAGEASSKVDNPVYNWGRDTHQKSEEWLADAQAGESGAERFLHNAAMSAGENLALGAVNPALVLPVLSLQGAGDSLAASDAKGESPEKAMAKAALKFGAGWAINSVGAADLAETMGSDYAKNTVAGQIAGWVRGMAGKSDFAQKYPAIANAVTGGIDNAMQAFVESYADQAIDAAMGDTEAAKQMLTQENFLSALESGLSGGVSGAMGGAAGTGVRVVKAKAEQKVQNAMEARAQAAQKAAAEKAKTPSVTSGDSSLGEGALEGQTAVNDDPAVHTAAQNASIEEYKNSVDPAMAKYVDDVRAGKKLEPFVVSKTGDRMRSAMMELTGLDKVGDYTMLDNNGVMHITNRHAGGDGSADATMKESADVARAAYVLNNFDNAYLAKDRADGYMTSNGKRAPIVLFEKKIDGSHIVVEAVCDTKKNKNFIVSEYLSKNGVDEKEIAKVLRSPVNAAADPEDNVRNVVADPSAMIAPPPQSPMDAVADFRDTSETLAEDHGAEASIAPETARVNEKGVENAGKTVETALSVLRPADSGASRSSPEEGALLQGSPTEESAATEGREYADVDRKVDPAGLDAADEGSGKMRETYGLREPSGQTARQSEVQRQLEQWGVEGGKTKAAQDISQKLPTNVDADRYAAAASTIYHLAQMDEVKSFDDALRLAGVMDNTALNVNYILDSGEGGRIALNTAYLYGADTKEQAGGYGGGLTDQSTSGQGLVYYKGTLDHDGTDMGSRIIELNAAATGTDAVLKNVLQNNPNVRAYVNSETARIFFGDSVSDIFGTVLHEDYHWYNSLDQAGAKSLQDHALTYLAQMDGYESVDEMIRDKMDVYASQKLTYEQAAEELVADAWRGIFATEADFKRWVEFQRGQAEKNAGVRGSIHKVMNRVKNLLSDIISRAKEVLTIDPSNAAALKAKRLAEAQRRTLQDEYFAHAEKAMDALRAAKENAAALKTESAAEGRSMRFQLQEGEETLEKQLNRNLGRLEQMTPAAEITGKEIEYGATSKENAENIVRFFESIGGKVERDGFGVVELTRKGAKATVQHGNGPVKQIAAAAIPNVIRYGEQIGFVENWKGRGYNTYTFVAPVMVGETKIYEAVIVNEYTVPNAASKFYVHEVCGSDGSLLTIENGKITKKENSLTSVFKTEQGGEAPKLFSESSIAQENAESKGNSEPVKKSVRFQLSAPVEVDHNKDLVAVHNLTEENLKEALELGGMPSPSIAVVKAQEGHTKYGPISLVFNSDTIAPMVNRANRIYGSDAWTPTRPNVEYAVNGKALTAFEKAIYNASEDAFEGKFVNSAALQRMGVGEVSSENRTELAQKLQRETAVQLAYLKEKGQTVEPIYKTERETFDSMGNDMLEKVVERAGADEIKNAFENGDFDLLDKMADKAADALEEKYTHGALAGQNKRWQMRIDKLRKENRGRLYGLIEHAYKMLTDTSAGKAMLDVEATREAIREAAPEAQVERWAYDKLGDVLGEKGIRNQKDRFTRSGKSRSFAELHNPYTLENLVAAMNAQNARGQDTWGLSASTLMSTATAEYQNLDEVRADKGRLQQMPEEAYKALLEKADHQIEAVIGKLRSETEAHADNSFEEREILGDILLRAAQGKQTMAAVSKAFSKEGYTISRETAKQIVALYKTIADIPTGYFEAKPQRAVEFDEVRAAIVPDNASAALLDSLKEKGVTVYEYKAGDDAQRTKVLNQVPNVRFQMAEQADRDAKRNRQRQASRTIADNSAAIKTLTEMMGLTRGVRVSDDSILGVAERLVKASGAKGKADTERVAREMRTLIEYMKTEGADMNKAQGLAETIAGEILDEATYRNTELWQQYPEYHELSYTVDKNGKAKAELVRQYGSWSEAVAEARKHGVKLRQEEGHRDGNPAEEYEAIVNDTRSMGGTKQGAAELFRGAAKAAGVDGAASMESTEWLDVLMNVHDTIKPKMMSRFADVAEYEDAKVELAGRMIGDLLNVNEMNDAQAIFDSFQQWQRRAAAAAAGDETSAAKAVKDLRAVQKEQTREFNRRLAENQKAGNQSEAVQQMQEQQRRNAKAEAMLDANLDALGVDITNSGDMAEKLDVLKEAYEREWRAEKKRLKEERQQMLDEITLENKTLKAENRDLARQVANEQRRADRAEYSQIVQEREIMEWEAENQKKAEAWQQKQAQKNAIAVEVVRQQRDEDIAVAKALAEKRVQRARDGRKADELKRSIRNNAAQLNQMILRPSKGKYVQPRLIQQAAEVAKLADMAVLNDAAVRKLTALANTISQTQGTASDPSSLAYDWEQTGVPKLIQALQADMMNAKQAKLDRLHQQLTEAEALGDGEKAERLRDRLKARIRETENRTYLPMTVEQLRMLKAITAGTLHVIRTENKTLSLAKTEEVDVFAQKAGLEVLAAKGNETGRIRDALTKYNLDMLGAKRVFRMLGGYTKNGQMEKLADMLNQGQLRQTQITVEGTKLFDNVTGKANLKQMERFAGPGAELVDIGLTDAKGKAVPLTHGQLCSLYMHLQNTDSREHLLNGGLTLPDTTLYNEGDIERAYQKGQTVKIGMLTGADGMPMADTILNTVENALTDYDRKWIEDMKGFFGDYTTNLINETSMKLVGFQRATVKNYYPIAVDKTQLASEIEGLKLDATIEGRGMLKERVKSGLPILLEECSSVVQRSLRDTAAYAGLAAPIRDANRILNANVETRDGIQKLKSGVLKEHWGRDAVNYVDYLLTDLQTKQRKRSDGIGRVMGKLRGNYAGAILTLNPGVAIAQAASLPTAGAVLGSDTMASVLPFVKNLSGKQLAALKAEISAHGDALLQYRLRGSQRGELASIGVSGSFAEKAMDKLPKSLTGWISKMDEITVAALWEGAKHYVEHHAGEFALSALRPADVGASRSSPMGSIAHDEAYWKAVNQVYQRVIEETQPNYTVMQRAGIQRNDNEIIKTLTMFTTQRFQNYGILADAVMDYNAQKARYRAEKSAENKAEVQRAGQSLRRAATSQVIQTAVFALMKIGADFLLHRWDREQDENGDITAWSFLKRYTDLFLESAASNPMFGSELYGLTSNLVSGTVYDVVSASNLTAINDLSEDAVRFYQLLRKDTSEMNEKELAAYHEKLRTYATTLVEDGMQVQGIPAGNAGKLMTAAWKWGENIVYAATKGEHGEQLSFHSTPSSATGQYDRLFNAIERGDAEEAAAALGKLDQMGKSDKVSSELKKRLKNYDPDIMEAAKARNAGDDRKRQKLTKKVIRELYDGLGISATAKSDRVKREAIIDLVTGDKHGGSSYGAINELADELLAGDKNRNVYDDLTDALEVGRAKDVQTEVNRLLTAGKKADDIKSKITGVVKSEYLAGNDHDREKLAEMLLRLEAGGEPLYEEKNFESWIKQDGKKQEAAAGAVDEWAEVR